MWTCEVSVDIQAPVEQVYRRLKDFTKHSEFSNGLVKVEQTTTGPAGVGTRLRAEERVPGKYVSFSEITALEELRLIAWKAWVPHVMRTRWEFRLERHALGTRLTQFSEWKPAGPLGFVMLNLHRKRHVPQENQQSLNRIREVIESERKQAVAS